MDIYVVTDCIDGNYEVRAVFSNLDVAMAYMSEYECDDWWQLPLNDPKIISSLTFT